MIRLTILVIFLLLCGGIVLTFICNSNEQNSNSSLAKIYSKEARYSTYSIKQIDSLTAHLNLRFTAANN